MEDTIEDKGKTRDDLLKEMLRASFGTCRKKGYRVDDPEYNSAIHTAVWRSWRRWFNTSVKDRPVKLSATSPISYAIKAAINACNLVWAQYKNWRSQELLYCVSEVYHDAPEHGTEPVESVPPDDLEILTFVHVHGSVASAKMLGMTPATLKQILDDIATAHIRDTSPSHTL